MTALVFALILDALIGDPDVLWRRWPHPVTWMGRAIAALDHRFNRPDLTFPQRKVAGAVVLAVLILATAVIGIVAETLFAETPGGRVLVALVASVFLAQQSLYRHVACVRSAFAARGLHAARQAVAMIVGRDTAILDGAGVCRAAIESCAENFSDGVVAPALWFALGGLPGLLVYKIVNTADSMIGHRTPRYVAFGWAAARTDDLLNLVPARLAAMLLAVVAPVVGGRIGRCWTIVRRDAGLHRSPNAGWPESAMAAALGLALAGPRRYGDAIVDDPFLNREGRLAATPDDIGRALRCLVAACLLQGLLYAMLALLV